MKKLFTLFALLVAIVTGAWADDTTLGGDVLYELTTTGDFGTAGTDITDGDVTLKTYTKGGVTYYAKDLLKEDADPYKWKLDGASGTILRLDLDKAIESGDVIEVYAKSSNNSRSINIFNAVGKTGADNAGAKISVNTTEQVYSVAVSTTGDNTLIGKTSIYLKWSNASTYGSISYIKIISGSTTTTALSSDKTWSYTGYDAPTSATTADFANSNMLYGKGIKMGTQSDFSGYSGYLLNLGGNHSTGFDPANGKYLMFKLPANTSGNIVIKHIPYSGSSTKTLTCKVGDAATDISKKGKSVLTSDDIPFSTTTETPVYIYVSSNHETYFIHSVEVTFTSATLSLSNVSGKTYGFGGYCGSKNFTVTSGTAYKASFANSKVVLTSLDGIVPAGEGVVIAGTPGANATINFTDEAADVDMDGNNLHGTTVRTLTSTLKGEYAKFITLQKSTGKFIPYTGEYFPANRAYMLLDNEGAAQSFDIVFDSETGVDAVAEAKAELGVKKVVENGKLVISNNGRKYNAAGAVIK